MSKSIFFVVIMSIISIKAYTYSANNQQKEKHNQYIQCHQ